MQKAVLFIVLFVAGAFFLSAQTKTPHPSEDGLTISFFDVGQGDATFVSFPNSVRMLVDCSVDARILPLLGDTLSHRDRRIDILVVTHPDRDHFGGCIDVLHRYDVDTIVHSGARKEQDTMWIAMEDAMDAEGAAVFVAKDAVWHVGDAEVRFLHTEEQFHDSNNASVVQKITYGEHSILLTGDVEIEGEDALLEQYADLLDVDVLKAGHHGSNTSSQEPFIAATSPDHVIVSSGKENHFGHPSLRVLKRFKRANSTVWRTDTHGTITLHATKETLTINEETDRTD